jgi:hypothetical protein
MNRRARDVYACWRPSGAPVCTHDKPENAELILMKFDIGFTTVDTFHF